MDFQKNPKIFSISSDRTLDVLLPLLAGGLVMRKLTCTGSWSPNTPWYNSLANSHHKNHRLEPIPRYSTALQSSDHRRRRLLKPLELESRGAEVFWMFETGKERRENEIGKSKTK